MNKHLLLILVGFGLIGCDNDFDNSAQRVNGIVLAVDKKIYSAENLKVGLFK